MAVFAEGFDVLTGGLVETRLRLAFPGFLELLERGGVLFALATQAVLLNAQIVELALVGEEDFRFDELFADGFFFVGEEFGEFQTADGVNSGFERRNALEAPFGVRQRLHEILFGFARGLIAFVEAGDVGFVERGVFSREQDRATRQTRFEGVPGRCGFTRVRCWTGGSLRIRTIGIELSVGGHI